MVELRPLATVEQVGHLLRADLDPDDPAVTFLVAWASELIRSHVGQTITQVTGDVVTLTPAHGKLTLPERPVTAVTALERLYRPTGLWTPVDAGDWTWDPETGTVFSTAGFNYYSGDPWWPAEWPYGGPYMRVTYDHGLEDVPASVAGATASLAAKMYNMPPGIVSERNGQRGANFRAEDFLSPIELASLGRFREARMA